MTEEFNESNYHFVEGFIDGYAQVDDETEVCQNKQEPIFAIEIINASDDEQTTEELRFISLNPFAKVSSFIDERTLLVKIEVFIDEVFFDKVYLVNNITKEKFEETITEIIEKRKS